MKKLLCIVLAIAILTGVLILPVSAASQNTSDKYVEQFEQYLTNIGYDPYYEGEKLYMYSELYEYYSDTNTSDTPDWVLVAGSANIEAPAECNGIFGKYNLFLGSIQFPYELLYHIYIPSQNKFYTLSDAWTERIEGLENAFTEYLVPNKRAELIEDADGDGKITEFDASKYDGYFTYYNSFEEFNSDDQTQSMISAKDAIAEYEAQTGEKVETNRYYFLMPNGKNGMTSKDVDYKYGEYASSWYNELVTSAGVYWWDTTQVNPDRWPGYALETADASDVYYADVPKEAALVIFNNSVNGGMDPEDPIYYLAEQTYNVGSEYYEPGENDNYPNGTESFDNMIFVVSPVNVPCCDLTSQLTWGGEWFYYYGDGCYGIVKDGDTSNCIRDDHDHKYLFKDKLISKYDYEPNTAEYMDYEEMYYHYDENGNMDWVLLYANVHNTDPWIYNIIFRDRILMCGTNRPFSFGYGIYDVKADEFHDIITDEIQNYFFDLSAYDGLEEVFDSLKIGYPIGDANHDHELSIMDATQIQLVLAKLATFEYEDRVENYHGYKDWSELGYPKYISDINCDGERNILDATAIQMKLAKLA